MSTETEVVDGAGEVVTPEVEVVADPVVEQASSQGWVPKEDWVKAGKDEAEWRPAKEFVERGELYKSIHTIKRELKQERAAREALAKHHQYVFEKARLAAINELKQERRQALRDGELERVEEIEDKLEQTQQQFAQEKAALVQAQAAAQAGPPAEFETWKATNTWYDQDQEMHEFADATGLIFINKNPSAQPKEVLAHIDTKMRKQFPEKFNIKRAAPNAVAGVDRTGNKPSRTSEPAIDPEMEKVIKNFTEATGMSRADYIKELKKIGAI
jgi:predicted DNA-binding protein (UPF0278 family)